MIKIIKIIYVYILNTLDFNKIMVTNDKGIKSEAKMKVVITSIVSLLYGYGIYKVSDYINIKEPSYLFGIGMLLATILCFFINIKPIKEQVFFNKDKELLAVMPLTNNQILFSKLFFIYLKDLLYVFIIMGALLISYGQKNSIDETFLLIYILDLLVIPLLPIILTTSLILIGYYIRKKIGNIIFNVIRLLVIIGVVLGIYYYTRNVSLVDGFDGIVTLIFNKLSLIYPFAAFFRNSLLFDYLSFILFIGISIIFVYLYFVLLSDSYDKLNTSIKKIKEKEVKELKYHGCIKMISLIRKDLKQIMSNKALRNKSVLVPYVICFGIMFISLYLKDVDKTGYMKMLEFFIPIIMSINVSLIMVNLMGISMEAENLRMLMSMPLGRLKILFSKIIASIIIGIPIILINYLSVFMLLKMNMFVGIMSLVLPFLVLVFMSILCLLIDLKNPIFDLERVSNRLLNIIPSFIVLLYAFSSFILYKSPYIEKKVYLLTYAVIVGIIVLLEFAYLIIFNKKMLKKIFN